MTTPDVSLEQFGYRQELKRSLSQSDLVIYGLVFITPTVPFGSFGIVFNLSHGMVPLVYLVGTIAMLFTAISYMTMSRAFPIAGSVYSYAGRGIGERTGFITGWVMLLDYILIPVGSFVAVAIAVQAVLPDVPRSFTIVLCIIFTTVVNLIGIEMTARLNRYMLGFQFFILGLFMLFGCIALANGVAGAQLSATPLFNPSEVSASLIFGALAIATGSFLGFDAISTLAEETKGAPTLVGRATVAALCLVGTLFVAQTYLASLFVLGERSFPPGEPTDAAFYNIAAVIGGSWLTLATSVFGVGLGMVASIVTAQTATARLLFSMARDGKLPRLLAYVHPVRKVPERAVLLVAAINFALAFVLANQFQLVISLINFGALTGFLMLHLSVLIHFAWRARSKDRIRHFIVPLIGLLIIGYVLINLAIPAKIVGVVWLTIGVAVLIGLKLSGRAATLPTSAE